MCVTSDFSIGVCKVTVSLADLVWSGLFSSHVCEPEVLLKICAIYSVVAVWHIRVSPHPL